MRPVSVTLYQRINGEASINHAVQVIVSHIETIEVMPVEGEATIILKMASGNVEYFPYDSNYEKYVKLTQYFEPVPHPFQS